MKKLFMLTAVMATMMVVGGIFMSRVNAKTESFVGPTCPPIVVSHIDCSELLIVQTQAPTGLQGTTGTAQVRQPNGTVVSVPLTFAGYFGGTAKWSAPYNEYYDNQPGVFVVLSAEVAGHPALNTPYTSTIVGCAPLSVRVNYFESVLAKAGVILSWETATEIDLQGFNVYRRSLNSLKDESLSEWKQVGSFVPANVGSPLGQSYQIIDSQIASGAYEYVLEEVLTDGSHLRDWFTVIKW